MLADMTTTPDSAGRVPRQRPPRPAAVVAKLVAGAFVLWAIFVGLGELIRHFWMHSQLGHDDGRVDTFLAAHRTSTGRTVSLVLVYLADTKTVIAITALVIIGLYLARRRWREPLFLLAAVIGEVTTFVAVTSVVKRPRPPVPHLDVSPPTSSFPSGHTAAAICLYGALALIGAALLHRAILRRLLWTLAVLVPVLVAAGRLYRGMHFPTDVLAGGLLGVLWLTWLTRVYPLGKDDARATTTRA